MWTTRRLETFLVFPPGGRGASHKEATLYPGSLGKEPGYEVDKEVEENSNLLYLIGQVLLRQLTHEHHSQDALRAKRNQEEAEREWRKKEMREAENKWVASEGERSFLARLQADNT